MPKAKEKQVVSKNENNKLVNLQALPGSIKKINIRIVMVLALIIMAFAIGRLTQKVEDLQGGSLAANNANTAATSSTATTATPKISIDTVKGLWSKDVIKLGDANSKLLFVEIGDPSCPYCHAAGGENHTIYQSLGPTFQLVADGGTYQSPVTEVRKLVDAGKASIAYIYFPGHGNGEMGMKALYCANEKGKFWQAHDLLMSDSGYTLMNNTVKNDKTQSGAVATFLKGAVDPTFLKGCLDSGKYDARLAADQTLASTVFTSAGMSAGTPGFIVNDTGFGGAYSWTDMKSVVDTALN